MDSFQEVQFLVLGPLEVLAEGRVVGLGGSKPRLVLANLLVHANEVVSADRLIDTLWADGPPDTALTTLQKHISRLRVAIEPRRAPGGLSARLVTRPPGYLLRVEPAECDATRFERIVADAQGRAADGDLARATELLDAALGLWRGPAWAEFADEDFARAEVARLDGLRAVAMEERVEVALAAGRHGEMVGELEATTAAYPLRERPRAQLMLALYRCGRHAEALRAYEAFRRYLGEEVGLEPSAALVQLADAIVLQKPELDWAPTVGAGDALGAPVVVAARPAGDVAPPPMPEVLVPDVGALVGRETELEWLEVLWRRAAAGEPGVALLVGPAGVGKTRLVAEFARAVHARGGAVTYHRGMSPEVARGTATGPALVVVDDLDAVAAALLLQQPSTNAAALIVGLSRERPPCGDVEGEGEGKGKGGGWVSVRELSALRAAGVAALLERAAGPQPEELVEAVLAETAGLPSLVVEVARGLRDRQAGERVERALRRAETARTELQSAHEAIAADVIRRGRRSDGGAPVPAAVGVCPYRGLARFDTVDAGYFFGRERLVATLVARLAVERFVGVIGASGSGKSSLVRAGLLPALVGGALPGSAEWAIAVCTPGADPVAHLAGALAPVLLESEELVRGRLDANADELARMARRAYAAPSGVRLLLVVDQFEELVTACQDAGARERFVDAVVDAVSEPDGPLAVVPVVRADYYGALAVCPELARLFEQSQVLVGAMTDSELRRAVVEPARRVGLVLEEGLADAVCRDAAGEPGALPLVSTALLETWVRREGDALTIAGYEDAGGVRGALARLAEDAYARLGADEQALARRMFLRLAAPGEGNDDVRRRVARDELPASAQADSALGAFVRHRLLVADGGFVDVAHEALLREWPRLRGWLEEDRAARRLHRQLTEAAAAWEADGRDAGALYRGARLAAAHEWATTHPDDPNLLEREFLAASTSAHEDDARAARRTARRLRLLAVGLSLLLVVALVAGVVAVVQRQRASRQAARAKAAALDAQVSRVATLARTLGSDQVDLALLLGVEGRRFESSVATEGALEAALAHVPPGLEQVLRLSSPTTFPHLSRDSRRLAVPEPRSGVVEIWDLASGRLLRTLSGPTAPPFVAFFNADASLVVDTRNDGMARVWDVASGRQLGAPLPIGGTSGYAQFVDAQGARLLTATSTSPTATTTEGRVVVWDRQDPQHPRPVGQPFIVQMSPGVTGIEAGTSSDGRVLFVSGSTTTVLWDVASHRQLLQLPGTLGAFTPDGASVATVEGDHVSLWDPRTGMRRGAALPDIPRAPVPAEFSPDGRLVAVTDNNVDGRVWVFDVASRRQVAALTLGPGRYPVAFLPDDRLVTAAGALVEVWRLGVAVPPMGVALGPPGVVGVDFAAGGTEVDTWDQVDPSRPMRRWDGVTGAAKGRLLDARAQPPALPFPVPLFSVAPSPAGTAVAVVGQDGRVHLWDRATGEEVAVLDGHRGGERGAIWSPAGDRIATAGASQSVLVWDVSDLRHPVLSGPPLVAPGGPPPPGWPSFRSWVDPRFSHDGRLIAIVHQVPGGVTLFDRASGAVKWSVEFPNAITAVPNVYWAAFSPDDKVIAVTSSASPSDSNFTVTLLDVASGTRQRPLLPIGSGLGLAFLDGGRVLVTTSGAAGSQVAQLWDTSTLQPIGDPLPAGALGGVLAGLSWGAPVDASPDGKRFVTDGAGPTLGPVLWDADPADWAATSCRIAGRNLTRAEWDQYFQGRPYHATCPQWPPGT
jgi:DNA-binding SARP family transcriptional activator/WD40 repeat protein/energy-coupling factor transporter ATP-binding protein EcfA2